MQRVIMTSIEALTGAVVFVPLLFVLDKFCFHSVKRTAVYSLFAFYLAFIYAVAGLPNVCNFKFDTFVYLLPFVGMIYDVKNSILNVLLFVPLGIFLPLLCDKYTKLKNTLLFGVLTTLTVELLQFFTYRKTDVNDVITNTVGTVIGFLTTMLLIKKLPKAQAKGSVKEMLTAVAVTFCVMFFIQPYVSSLLWKLIR